MTVPALLDALDARELEDSGDRMFELVRAAYPLPRSITGDGVRQTLRLFDDWLGNGVTLAVSEVPSGTQVLDWTVPPEWNVREAWIETPGGERIADYERHRLHLLGYSTPVEAELPLAELERHLYSLPEQPDLIPYRTSYYAERWGFCLPHRVRSGLRDGTYRVKIDGSLEPGALTYAEIVLPGRSEREVLLSCHICHPQLANDNLSALAVLGELARRLARLDPSERRYTVRFVLAPGTIGAITWLAQHPDCQQRIAHGLVAANLGDPGGLHYKQSRRHDASINRAVVRALARLGEPLEVEEFVPFGYDERQYCSPGFDLPAGSLTRTPWGRYPEYHTSADDLELVGPDALAGSLRAYLSVLSELEQDRVLRNREPFGEPQLGRRGLYSSLGGSDAGRERELAMLWVLNQSDGAAGLRDIAERSGIELERIEEAAERLLEAELLEVVE